MQSRQINNKEMQVKIAWLWYKPYLMSFGEHVSLFVKQKTLLWAPKTQLCILLRLKAPFSSKKSHWVLRAPMNHKYSPVRSKNLIKLFSRQTIYLIFFERQTIAQIPNKYFELHSALDKFPEAPVKPSKPG